MIYNAITGLLFELTFKNWGDINQLLRIFSRTAPGLAYLL